VEKGHKMAGDRSFEVFNGELLTTTTQNELRDRIAWMVSQVNGHDVLDIGCSQGVVTNLLAKEGYSVVGVDPDPEVLKYASEVMRAESQEVQNRVRLLSGNALDLGLEYGSHDTVVLGEVIEHIPSPKPLIELCYNVLRHNGRVIITTPFGVLRHPDHFATYYWANFSELVLPYFKPVEMKIIGKRICFVGQRREQVVTGLGIETNNAINMLRESELEFEEIENRLLDDIDDRRQRSLRQQTRIATLEAQKKKLLHSSDELKARINQNTLEIGSLVEQTSLLKARLISNRLRRILRSSKRPVGNFKRLVVKFKRRSHRSFQERIRQLISTPVVFGLLQRHKSFQRFATKMSPAAGNFLVTLHHRNGDINLAYGLSGVWSPSGVKTKNLKARVRDMGELLENGWQQPIKELDAKVKYNRSVLFALHNSLPFDNAGYAIRSHSILSYLEHHGLDVNAATRPGYPSDLNMHSGKKVNGLDLIDDVPYRRISANATNAYGRVADRVYVKHYSEQLSEIASLNSSSVVVGASSYLNGLAAAETGRSKGIRSIYEMRGLWHVTRLTREPEFIDKDLFRYQQLMEQAAADAVDDVIVLSGSMKSLVCSWGVAESKITVIPNAVNADHFVPMEPDEDLKRKLGMQGRLVVGFLGSITNYEGIDLIIKAVVELVDAGENIGLVIVGSGRALGELQELVSSLSASNYIKFTGKVPFEQVPQYYSIFDICPFPRKNFEVCRYVPPLKILETMAMKKAVIVSALAPLEEMVIDGDTGVVCAADSVDSLRESINNLYKNKQSRTKLGLAARDWVLANRSWNAISKRYIDLFERTE